MRDGRVDSDDPASVFAAGVELIGGQTATARLFAVTQPTVWRWLKAGKPCPADYVPLFSTATGYPRNRIRPDLYEDRSDLSDHPTGGRA